MPDKPRIVVDTNALVSRLLLPGSVPALAVSKALNTGQLLVSEATMNELADVLSRPRFDRYLTLEDRRQFFLLLGRVAELISILCPVRACRDSRDDKFLEVALSGSADRIVTGDADLLAMHPFHEIAIVTPQAFLENSTPPFC